MGTKVTRTPVFKKGKKRVQNKKKINKKIYMTKYLSKSASLTDYLVRRSVRTSDMAIGSLSAHRSLAHLFISSKSKIYVLTKIYFISYAGVLSTPMLWSMFDVRIVIEKINILNMIFFFVRE